MTPRPELDSWRSEKIQSHHLDRLAIVYVRQSTLQQVLDHQESTRLQYGLVHRAEALGWPTERVLTIDEDLGKSGSSAADRLGFQRLVSEVGLNHVGLVLGIEMSRLARSSKDWHQLLEICALFSTLIGDLDGIYDPTQYNDRLLLGLKGTMSEAELHILKQRLVQGKLNKAQRGELGFHVPIGYVRRPCGDIIFDPDEQVRDVVKLIFRKFEELGSLNAVLRYLVSHQIQLGVRVFSGPNKGDLTWRRPNRQTLQNLLKNPSYAGAYAYGRSHSDPRKRQAGRPYTGSVVTPPEDWPVLIQDHHPAYISWQQYQDNLDQLRANQTRADTLGITRQGDSLLSGLLVCGRCGARMTVQYRRSQQYRYTCCQEATEYGGEICQYLSGPCLDHHVSEQVLQALAPAAVELSLEAALHLEHDRAQLDHLWQQRLERTAFEAERAGRHYRLLEPENRLVARQLAHDWETQLQTYQQLQEDYQRFCQQQPRQLSEEDRQLIRQLANDLPTLWHSEITTQGQRKAILRQVIQSIRVTVVGDTEQVEVAIQWVGGDRHQATITRPVAKWTQMSNYPQLCQRLEQLVQAELSTDEMIQILHQEGFRPPKQRQTFNADGLRSLIRHLNLGSIRQQLRRAPLAESEWWLPDLARVLEMPTMTLYDWVRRGWVNARQPTQGPKHWIIWADDAEIERLKAHRQIPFGEILRQRWRGEVPTITLKPERPETLFCHTVEQKEFNDG